MSEKSDQDQDQGLDQNPGEQSLDVLADVDALLAAEDPEFLEQLKKIKIDPISESAALDGSLSIDSRVSHNFLHFFKQTLDFQTNLRAVAIFWGTFLIALAIIAFVWMNQLGFLHQNLFLNSFEKIGGPVTDFNPNNETEAFYDNPRFARNLVTLPSIFVNIKSSENSGENPMMVFEVTIEGLSSDAIIEIKDRQVEFKDLISRLAEDKTYDNMVSTQGKRQLAEQIQDLLNANLTRGQVRRVMFKNFITNPNN